MRSTRRSSSATIRRSGAGRWLSAARARGVVAAASYEARAYGVRSAMASATARRRCPPLLFVPPRFEVYRTVSARVREIFAEYTDLIEPLSLDEAYLDVTDDARGLGSGTAIAQAIRARIRAETGLTASAGVSYNKFLAKVASDQHKPDGLCVVPPAQGAAFVAGLPVTRFHGVGPVTAARRAQLGIVTGSDLRDRTLVELRAAFGKAAEYFYWAARGRDDRPVRPDRARKSVGAERTFERDLVEEAALLAALERVTDALWPRVDAARAVGRTVTLKVKYADFHQITRARSFVTPVGDRPTIAAAGVELLRALGPFERGVRLLGLTLSGLSSDGPVDARGQLVLTFA